MKYTSKDIWAARDYKKLGYNWVARDKDGEIAVFQNKPDKGSEGWMVEHLWSHSKWEIIPGHLFGLTTWEDSGPTNLNDIISSEKGALKYERLTTSKS